MAMETQQSKNALEVTFSQQIRLTCSICVGCHDSRFELPYPLDQTPLSNRRRL